MSFNRSASLGLALALASVACGGGRPLDDGPDTAQAAVVVCDPSEGSLDPAATAASLAGSYHLTMIAATGARDGDTVTGTITLAGMLGSAEIALEQVGALRLGSLTLADSSEPGVRVIETHAPRHAILLRLGSQANREGELRFDGGYSVLDIRRVGGDSFAGVWRSGGAGEEATGWFCARRS